MLLTEVRLSGAKNLVESSLPYVDESLRGIMRDPVLSNFPFDQASFAEIVYRVIRSGTVLERAALARQLTPKSASFFPNVGTQVGKSFELIQTAIEDIFKPMFKILADHYGVPFNGDQNSVAYSLITEYGGLSFADFLIFFERVKSGRYRTEFQHIATRGINSDFLFTWLDQYVEEKVIEVDEMYNQHKNPDESVKVDPSAGERIRLARERNEAEKARRLGLEEQAQTLRHEYESSLYQSIAVVQAFKNTYREIQKIDQSNGRPVFDSNDRPVYIRTKVETLCDEDDPDVTRRDVLPYRIPSPGSIERRIKRTIFEFVTFGSYTETITFFDEFEARVREKYRGEVGTLEELVEYEFKTILNQVSQVRKAVTVRNVIEAGLGNATDGYSPSQIGEYITTTVIGFESFYFDEYLPQCIAKKYPPLTKEDFVFASILEIAVSNEFKNPIRTVFE